MLKNLVGLVTGGGSGLGRATVERLIQQGHKVILCDLEVSKGAEVAEKLGKDVYFLPTDVTSEENVRAAVDYAQSKFNKLDVVVNCAGIAVAHQIYSPVKDRCHDLEDFVNVMQATVVGTFNVNRFCARLMYHNKPDSEGQRGVIINTAGTAAFDGVKGQAAVSAAHGGVVSMTLPLARELSEYGVRVLTIAPGLIDTPLMSFPAKYRAFLEQTSPFPHRFGKPEEFALLVESIIQNPLLNGEVIRLDGAIRHSFLR